MKFLQHIIAWAFMLSVMIAAAAAVVWLPP